MNQDSTQKNIIEMFMNDSKLNLQDVSSLLEKYEIDIINQTKINSAIKKIKSNLKDFPQLKKIPTGKTLKTLTSEGWKNKPQMKDYYEGKTELEIKEKKMLDIHLYYLEKLLKIVNLLQPKGENKESSFDFNKTDSQKGKTKPKERNFIKSYCENSKYYLMDNTKILIEKNGVSKTFISRHFGKGKDINKSKIFIEELILLLDNQIIDTEEDIKKTIEEKLFENPAYDENLIIEIAQPVIDMMLSNKEYLKNKLLELKNKTLPAEHIEKSKKESEQTKNLRQDIKKNSNKRSYNDNFGYSDENETKENYWGEDRDENQPF